MIKSVPDDAHVHIPVRECAIYNKIAKLNKGPMNNEAMQAIYRQKGNNLVITF